MHIKVKLMICTDLCSSKKNDQYLNCIMITKCLYSSNAYPLPLPNFGNLWCIILKLLTEKEDCVTSRITVITQWQPVLFSTELPRAVIS